MQKLKQQGLASMWLHERPQMGQIGSLYAQFPT
jgi:hypothetical protein